MKHFFIFLTFVLVGLFAQAQCNSVDFDLLIQQGDQFTKTEKYEQAVKKYSAAMVACPDKAKIAQDKIVKVFQKIEELKLKAEKNEKAARAALARADEMQRKMEIATFDKAVKERNKEWKGYTNYDWSRSYEEETKKGFEILSKIDSLDLSNNALLRIPREVSECKNLKHLNLFDNLDINWKQSDSTLMQLTEQTALFVSVYDLDSLPQTHWHKIKGIDPRQRIIGKTKNGNNIYQPFSEIPQNLLAQQQLTWLKIKGGGWFENTFTKLPQELFTMQHLQHLELGFGSIDTLPAEIGNLTNLTSLDLWGNNLTSLPAEIGNLTNLTSLDLDRNYLSSLPAEIGNLTNLTSLVLSRNDLTSLPAEIGNLSLLTSLNLSYNINLSSLPAEIGNLSLLTSLDLSGYSDIPGNLSSLPDEIGNLTNLTLLDLGGNLLTNINAVKSLENLEILAFSTNPITELPIEIAKFKNLKYLSLRDFSKLKISTQNLTEFIKTCPKKVQLTRDWNMKNEDNSILLINVDPIAEEWKTLPNVEVVRW